jgi:hypothetical protein
MRRRTWCGAQCPTRRLRGLRRPSCWPATVTPLGAARCGVGAQSLTASAHHLTHLPPSPPPAMALDLASPLVPGAFLLLACLGSLARAMVGVAAGATHAALTQHFAAAVGARGSAGAAAADLTAKADSRERAISIIGSILGMGVTHAVAGEAAALRPRSRHRGHHPAESGQRHRACCRRAPASRRAPARLCGRLKRPPFCCTRSAARAGPSWPRVALAASKGPHLPSPPPHTPRQTMCTPHGPCLSC